MLADNDRDKYPITSEKRNVDLVQKFLNPYPMPATGFYNLIIWFQVQSIFSIFVSNSK